MVAKSEKSEAVGTDQAFVERASKLGSEVAVRPTFALANPDAVREFLTTDWLTDVDATESAIGIIDQVFTAQNIEELLAEQSEAQSWRDHADEPFTLTGGMRFLQSDPKFVNDTTILPAFVVVQAVNAAGEQVILTTGAYKVVSQLWKGWQEGWWAEPQTVKLVGKETRSGYTAYSIVKA